MRNGLGGILVILGLVLWLIFGWTIIDVIVALIG